MHLIKIHAPAQLSWLGLPIQQLKLELIQISYDANNDLFKIQENNKNLMNIL